ncbi:MAG TPA: thioesterase [Caldithrix abyssi]|uniref:Thioesterase n=1 Tax=Caldithrix abyssi TaxID=187145 RepID=A0A7V1PW27_CALAY|nr:thioesterase [Caldithrix abyssi]
MQKEEIEHYLFTHIPLSTAMRVRVVEADWDHVLMSAPLEPNINHRQSAFGGSVASLAMLTAWTLIYFRLRKHNHLVRVVIHQNEIHFTKPITDKFEALTDPVDDADWEHFDKMLQRKGIARIEVTVRIMFAGVEAGCFKGRFVALSTL